MKESEILDIIERRKILVETATSEAQKEIYQGYLESWEEKLGIKPEPPQKTPKELALEKARAAKIAKKAELEKELEEALEELAKEEEAEIIEEVLNPEEIE